MGTLIALPQRHDGWENWVPARDLARHLGVSERSIRRWARAGMPSRRLGGCRRYRISEAETWLAEREATRA